MRKISSQFDAVLADLEQIVTSSSFRLFLEETSAVLYADFEARMTRSEAAALIGVSPDADVSTIKKAHAKAIFSVHPDQGGSTEQAAKLNVARDILLGKRAAAPEGYRPSTGYTGYSPPPSRPKPEKEVVTLEQAMRDGLVPEHTQWVFKTETAYEGYGDKHIMGFVAYGKTDTLHVFISVENYQNQDPYTGEDADIWMVDSYKRDLGAGEVATIAPTVIKNLWGNFQHIKKAYNNRVVLLDGPPSFKTLFGAHSRGMAFKDAMTQLGFSAPATNRKVIIDMEIDDEMRESDNDARLVINGKVYKLGQAAYALMAKRGLLKLIFGEYFHQGGKKTLTRMPKFLQIADWLLNNLSLDDEVEQGLKTAIQQKTK